MRLWILAFTLLPILGQCYAMWRIWQMLPLPTPWRVAAMVLLALPMLLFFAAFVCPLDRMPFAAAAAIYEIGTAWLFILIYLVMSLLLIDLMRMVHIVPQSITKGSAVASVALAVWMVGLFVAANVHYNNKVKQTLTLRPTTPSAQLPKKIVMMADLHLGYTNRQAEARRWVDMVNAEQPDLILIAGDIIDGSHRALRDQRMAQELRRLKAPVYACLGNHEYIAGVDGSISFYREAGIHLLRDSVATVGGLTIIGRDDRTNPRRLPLSQLVQQTDSTSLTILLDHQPYHLEEAEQCGIDFQLSGHTHYGQVWPISWIEDRLYECAFGEHQRGRTRYYVTSGMGIWGGKFRIGTRSEYVVMEISS